MISVDYEGGDPEGLAVEIQEASDDEIVAVMTELYFLLSTEERLRLKRNIR